uniref:Uncharacterized protein n=1 Tax=uncultured bacterium contig00053 TaxID=1181537 RepID=A0A806KB41_9BACT|nr:hypothetical protein [uncultured bacterium contig00053]
MLVNFLFFDYIIIMTIEQTVTIPADHRLFFEFLVPKEIPEGSARVEVKVTPVTNNQSSNLIKNTNKPTPRADRLLGIASHLGNISLDEIRAERLSKYQ